MLILIVSLLVTELCSGALHGRRLLISGDLAEKDEAHGMIPIYLLIGYSCNY